MEDYCFQENYELGPPFFNPTWPRVIGVLELVSKTPIALMFLFYNCIILNIGHIYYCFTCTYMFEYFHNDIHVRSLSYIVFD